MTSRILPANGAEAYRTGVLLVLAAGTLWSTIGIGVRLIENAGVWQILLYRSISMSLFLYAVIRLRSGESPFVQIRRVGFPVVIAGLTLFGAYSSAIYAIQNTSVANAMLLFAAAPFMAAVLGWIVLREPVRITTWLTMTLAIIGIAIMVADGSGDVRLNGSVAALASAFFFAAFSVSLRWGRTEDMLPAVFVSGLLAIAITLILCLSLELSLSLTVRDGGIAIGMGVFQAGAGLILFTLGSRSLPAAELALLSMTEVLLGPVWVWLFLGETAGINTMFGGVLLLTAITTNAWSGQRHQMSSRG